MAKITAKGSSFTFKTNVIDITKIGIESDVTMADSTDSSNYDAASDLVWKAQLRNTGQIKLSVEGRFDTVKTLPQVVQELFSGNAAGAAIVKFSPSVVFGHGNFDLTDFKVEGEIDSSNALSCSFNLVSNGVFTFGS